MNIQLYKNLSEKNHVDKNITAMGNVISGTLRNDCSIIDPVIAIEAIQDFDIVHCNYAAIEEFGRYYYINNIVCKGNLFELHMHVDVLMSFKNGIRNNSAVIARQENAYNLYLADGVFKTYADPHYQIMKFPSGFSSFNYVLAVSGSQ